MHAPEATSRFFATPIQTIARVLGMALLVVGVLGFVPIEALAVAAPYGVLHATFGVVGLLASRTLGSARAYFTWGGVIFYALAAYGLLIDHGGRANAAVDWLHLGLAIGMTVTVIALGRRRGRTVSGACTGNRAPREPHQ
jgi:hypothetical protein